MPRLWFCLFAISALMVVGSGSALGEQLDQQVPGRTGGYGFDRDDVRWQQFTPTLPILERIELRLWRVGDPGDILVNVADDSGASLWGVTIAESDVPYGQHWTSLSIPELALTPETLYRIYVAGAESSASPDNRYFWEGVIESSYTRGTSSVAGGSWPDYDFCFKTYGEVPEPATLSLLAMGGLGIAWMRRRRK